MNARTTKSCLQKKLISKSHDILESKEAKGYAPFDGEEHSESSEYRWFKPLNAQGVDLLDDVFGIMLDSDHIGKWICVEIFEDCGEAFYYTLEQCLRYAEEMKARFGIETKEDSHYE